MSKNPVLFNKALVIGIIVLFIGMSVVSSTRNTTMITNFSVINSKMDSPIVLLDENFSGTFPPEGWETGFFDQSNSICCDSEPPCAHGNWSVGYYDNFMRSKAIDASNYEKCIIKFYFGAQGDFYQYFTVSLKYRRNETSPWIDITPWDNPMVEVCDYYETEITYDLEGCGEALQIQWLFLGYYYYFLDDFCIDDVTILGIPINNPPEAPLIDGPPSGKVDVEYEYTFNATDPEGDPVMYFIDWGDNDTEWTEFSDSGEEITLKHSWIEEGEYIIKVKAKDINDAESDLSEFEIEIPRTRASSYHCFEWLLERFSILKRLLYTYL